ncbi:MAG: tyrosine-type recombinase/integrase [Nitrospiraceae bacterium]|nr:tyrosine-type recombinase/integrase [Nitrospiraceae bacterium]
MGRVYQRGHTWWIQYYHQGQLFRESSRSPQKSVATAFLKKREGEVVDGRLPNLQADRTTFEDLTNLLIQDYRNNGRKTLTRVEQLVNHLKESFSKFRAHDITSPHLSRYIERRQQEKAAPATINRELAALKRMFNLAIKQTPPLVKPYTIPHIPKLKENNIRTGFFTHEEYQLLRGRLSDYLKIPFIIAYWTGMRSGEILGLQWDHVDLEKGWIRLDPGTTKNGEGRIIPLANEVTHGLKQWWRESRLKYPYCPWVCHYRGTWLRRIPKRTWKEACDKAHMPEKLFHDLRRTGVRNLIRSGISERVAMDISGHRTRSVFDRYNIVSEADLVQAKDKLNTLSTISSTMGKEKEGEIAVSC